ncbi:MAG: ATP-binding response regulator [Anaerolineae bacterium]
MSSDDWLPGPDSPPEVFVEEVRDCLAHLFDIAHLQQHSLLPRLVSPDVRDRRGRAQALREAVLQAVADLRPPAGVSPLDAAFRPYAILRRRYVEGQSAEAIQEALAISRRQFFREQRRAHEAAAALLWERRITADEAVGPREQTLGEELEDLGLHSQAFDLEQSVRQAVANVKSLADSRGVAMTIEASTPPIMAFADEAIARQLVVTLLSALIQSSSGGFLRLDVTTQENWAVARCHGLPLGAERLPEHLAVASRLAARVGGSLLVGDGDSDEVLLRLPSAHEEHVLVVDDNPKTLRLFQRYLEPHRYRVTPVQESADALRLVRELRPDAVILDVMMRGVDGWQVLQSLKTDPATRRIPIILCSVLDEDELAHTVGADLYLRKPVSQSALVAALVQVRRERGSGVASP